MPGRLLIIEDEGIIAADLEGTLARFGYQVVGVAGDAPEALQLAASAHPELALVDIRLRGPLDGVEVARRLGADLGLPCLFLTSHSDARTLDRAKAVGAYGFVLKPWNERELVTAIEVALEKRRLERRAEEHQRWLAAVLGSLGEGVVACDAEGRVVFANDAAARVVGLAAAAWVGQPLGEVLPLDVGGSVNLEAQARQVSRSGLGAQVRGRLAPATARPLDVEVALAPLRAPAGAPPGCVLVLRDLSSQLRQATDAAQADRLATLGLLATSVGHELNDPLMSLHANLTWLTAQLARPGGPVAATTPGALDDVPTVVAECLRGVERASEVVRQLRALGREPAGPPPPSDLRRAAQTAVRLTAGTLASRAQVSLEGPDGLLVATGETPLVQIFSTLLVDAAQARSPGEGGQHTVHLTWRAEGARVLVEVTDTGRGLSALEQRRLLEPFSAHGDHGGSGLGLAIVQRLVDAAGGRVSLASLERQGTTIRLDLPRAAVVPGPPAAAAPEAPVTPTRRRVLVVDDQRLVGVALARLLAAENDVEVETDAETAWDRLRSGHRWDTVLCDVMMPGLSGPAFYRRVAEVDPEQAGAFIFISGTSLAPSAVEALAGAAVPLLDKPIDSTQLARHLARRPATGGRRP